jgi:NhaP-type Na+/H+ or K+/H+ antiporter
VWTVFGITVGGSLIADGLDLPAIAYAILSLTVVRMVPVALALFGCRFQPATVAFIGWFGPRGLASIVFMIIALEGLHDAGQDTDVLVAAIGWTVLLSVVLHGFTAVPLARRYGARIAATAGDIPERELRDEPQPTQSQPPSNA